MQKKFLGNFLFLLFINVLVKPLYVFGIDLKVQHVVGEADYGLYFSLYNFAFIFYVVLDLGLTQYNSRIIAQDRSLLASHLTNFVIAKSILGILFYTCICIGAWILGFSSYELYLLSLIGTILVFISAGQYFRSNIAALHLFRLDAILSVINRFLLITILGWMLYGNFVSQFKIEHFIQVQMLTQGVAALIVCCITLRYIPTFRFSWDIRLIRQIIQEGYPYALLILLTTIYTRTDAVMLKELLPQQGTTEAGYYAAAYRFVDMATIMGVLIASQLLPMFARLLQEKNTTELKDLTQTAFKVVMFISISLAVGLSCYGDAVIAFFFPNYPISYVAWIFSLLILSFIPVASSYVFNTLMNANGSLRTLNIIGIIGVSLNMILNFILIPIYHAKGAVCATLLTQGLAALAHIYYAHRILAMPFPKRLFLQLLGFVISVFLLFQYLTPLLPLSWLLQLLLGGTICLPLAWAWKILDIRMLQDVKKNA